MKRLWALLMTAILAISICGCGNDKREQERQKEMNFVDNANSVVTTMLTGCVYAEEVCNKTVSVWHDAIYQELNMDTAPYTLADNGGYVSFSEAINSLYKSEGIKLLLNKINENKAEVDELMKKLVDPPEKYIAGYNTLTDYYKNYTGFMALAKSPSGSYQDYTAKFSEYEDNTSSAHELVKVQIPKSYEID